MSITSRAARTGLAAISVATVAALVLAAPAAAGTHRDSDHDGMSNGWERSHHLGWRTANAQGDADHDGLSNLKEFTLRLDPRDSDSDDDGQDDALEDADRDGVDNEDDADEFCAVVTQNANASNLDDDDDQGEDCDEAGDDENESEDD
jgi:hypothetical protein